MNNRRVAIITGASSGIGRALAERAVRAGWDVFAVGRRTDRLDALTASLQTAMGRVETLALDLREPGAARQIVRATLERFGRLDVLVNCAGGTAVGRITEQHDEALYDQMETHVIVPLALAREAMPSLRASKGLVVFFGSGVARIPVGTLGAYPPAKAAVRSMARVARNELAGDGVAVTYVDPGAVATEFMTRVGFVGPPASIAASPHDVARSVFAAFTSRATVVNAVPWQTFFVALGEALPRITDAILARNPGLVGGDPMLPPLPETSAVTTQVFSAAEPVATPETAESELQPEPEPAAKLEPKPEPEPEPESEAEQPETRQPQADQPKSDQSELQQPDSEQSEPDSALIDTRRLETSAPQNFYEAARDDAAESEHADPQSATDHAPAPAPVASLPVEAPTARDAANAAVDSVLAGAKSPDPFATTPAIPATSATFASTIETHAARMKKLNLKTTFVRDLLVPGNDLDLGYVAMRWAGMPNKNERGLTAEVLDALAASGFLERTGAEKFRVLRAPEPEAET